MSQGNVWCLQDSFNAATSPLGASPAGPYAVYGNPSLGFGTMPSQASPLGFASLPGAAPSPALASGQVPIYRPSNQVSAATSPVYSPSHAKLRLSCTILSFIWAACRESRTCLKVTFQSVLQLRGKTGSPHKGDGSLSQSSEDAFDAVLARLKTNRSALFNCSACTATRFPRCLHGPSPLPKSVPPLENVCIVPQPEVGGLRWLST